MTNKNKIINQAQKFITKGQWDKAIKELQKLIAEDPSDVRTLLKLGDVYSKKGDRDAASKVYRQVAESYGQQGFFLKAVAVYKQILKHDPKQLEVVLKLAELYEHLGLTSEATLQYQTAAALYEERGQAKESLDVLRRMVELDSENVASRIKLGEAYSRENLLEEASVELQKAAEILKRQGRIEEYMKVAERLVYHAPERLDLMKELARLYLDRSDPKKALAKLQLCFKAQPKDTEILTLLARAFDDLGQPTKTVAVYRELANAYEEKGRTNDARATLQRILDLDPNDAAARAALGLTNAPAPPVGRVEDVLFTQNLPALTSPPTLTLPSLPAEPAVWAHTADLMDSHGAGPWAGGLTGGSPTPADMWRPPSFNGVPAPSMSPRPMPLSPSVSPRPSPRPAPPPPRAESRSAAEPADLVASQTTKLLTETDVYVKYGLRDKALEHLRRVFALDPDSLPAYAKMRDIYLGLGDAARAAESVASMLHIHARRGDLTGLESARAELSRLAPGHPLAMGGLPGAIPPPPEHQDDSLSVDITEDSDADAFELVDFAEAERELVRAQDTGALPTPDFTDDWGNDGLLPLEPPEEYRPRPAYRATESAPFIDDESTLAIPEGLAPPPRFPPGYSPQDELDDPSSAARNTLADLVDQAASGLPTPVIEDDADPFAANMVSTSNPVASKSNSVAPAPKIEPQEDLGDQLEEVRFLVENGLLGEAREALEELLSRAPNHPEARALLARLEAEEHEDPSENQQEFAQGFDTTPVDNAPDPSAEIAGIAEALDDEEAVENAADLYDQGMLFMELGKHADAIREFRRVAKSPERRVAALEMIGHCWVQKGDPLAAIESFTEALEAGAEGPAAVNLKYEVGAAYEVAQDLPGALRWFRACAAVDPQHRDVQARLTAVEQALDAAMPPETPPEGPLPRRRSKVSYI